MRQGINNMLSKLPPLPHGVDPLADLYALRVKLRLEHPFLLPSLAATAALVISAGLLVLWIQPLRSVQGPCRTSGTPIMARA